MPVDKSRARFRHGWGTISPATTQGASLVSEHRGQLNWAARGKLRAALAPPSRVAKAMKLTGLKGDDTPISVQ